MISITVQHDQPTPVIIPAGRLDTVCSLEFEQALMPLAAQHDYLVIDMSQCLYLSSSGIRILLSAEKKLLARKGRLFLAGILPDVYQVIEMTGLNQLFRMSATPADACREIEQLVEHSGSTRIIRSGPLAFVYQPINPATEAARVWKQQGIAGYNELGLAIGTGSPAETPAEDLSVKGTFVSTGRCAGFVPDDRNLSPDYRIAHNPAQAGIFVHHALSFPGEPTGVLRLKEGGAIDISTLAAHITLIRQQLSGNQARPAALVVASFHPDTPSVSILMLPDSQEPGPTGVTFLLGETPVIPENNDLTTFLEHSLTLVNITAVDRLNAGLTIKDPVIWIWASNQVENASDKRLQVKTEGDFQLEPHKVFLARRLYTDSGRLEIKQIHGGYSAQTYAVTSYDPEGRKLRPTVMKIANRAMIARESERCQRYALPYILNNSAMVLGTEFYGDTGALRYNFVGIGGENSQLKWLTHYYHTWPAEQLEPLFDKIFLQILNPWYGQPISKPIQPFTDHDPTSTFFSNLFDTAEKELAVTPADRLVNIPETGQDILNPYWFVKNEYTRRRKEEMPYLTGICHGDLNMQNILLDEDMNVYLIDFSETKPRSLISDFARLEAIFMVDNAPLDNPEDVEEYIRFIFRFYSHIRLGEPPANTYRGVHQDKMSKNIALTRRMRHYAVNSVKGDPDPVPYCLALLEWVLPIVCYWSISPAHKRLSMIVSGLLCGQVNNR